MADPAIKCPKCSKSFAGKKKNLHCNSCSKKYHFSCTSLEPEQYTDLKCNKSYVCGNCRQSSFAPPTNGNLQLNAAAQNFEPVSPESLNPSNLRDIIKKLRNTDSLTSEKDLIIEAMKISVGAILKTMATMQSDVDLLKRENHLLKQQIWEKIRLQPTLQDKPSPRARSLSIPRKGTTSNFSYAALTEQHTEPNTLSNTAKGRSNLKKNKKENSNSKTSESNGSNRQIKARPVRVLKSPEVFKLN